jgi:hypothetical protein
MQSYNALSRPTPFGKLSPVGTGDANALRLTSNLESSGSNLPWGNQDQSQDLWLNKLEIKASPTNGGRIFICVGAAPYNTTTTMINGGGASPVIGGVIRALSPGEAWAIGDAVQTGPYHAGQFLIVIENATDWCSADGDVR